MASYDLEGEIPKPRLVNAKFEENEKTSIVYYYSKQKKTTNGTKWNDKNVKKLKKGTYYMYAKIGETSNYKPYITPPKMFKVYPNHKWRELPKRLTSKLQTKKIECNYCKKTETIILPKKTNNVVMGKKSQKINSRGCTFKLAKSAKTNYFDISKKGKIKTKLEPKVYKSMKTSIPVKVTAYGKTYSMKVKLKIPAPKVTVRKTPTEVRGVKGYKYEFNYYVPEADKVTVSMEGETKAIKAYLKKYASDPRPTNKQFINLSKGSLKQGNKATFKITAYYGSKRSEVCTVTR